MTILTHTQSDFDSRLKELEEENDLLLLQLHQVQEELEQYFLRNQQLEKDLAYVPQGKGWVDDELPEALAEVQRLRAIISTQATVHQLEMQNALNAQLGDILIEGIESPSKLMGVPGKLIKIWRQSDNNTPPATLGGKGYEKVVAAFADGGFEAVGKFLACHVLTPAVVGDAYTTLARTLLKTNPIGAAESARLAYAADPRPYRLKWLTFRLYDAGKVLEAEAMLDLLPKDIQISASESRQIDQVRYEAKSVRLRQAKQNSNFAERKSEAERQLSRLVQEREEQEKLTTGRMAEIEALQHLQAEFQSQFDQVKKENDTLLLKIAQGMEEVDCLNLKNQEQAELLTERQSHIDRLEQKQTVLEREKAALIKQHDEQAETITDQLQQINLLKKTQVELEQENAILIKGQVEQSEVTTDQQRQIEILRQAQVELEQENSVLIKRQVEQSEVTTAQQRQIEILRQAQVELEQENSVLVKRQVEQSEVTTAQQHQIEILRQAQAELEQENVILRKMQVEQSEVTTDQQRQIEILRQAQAELEQKNGVLIKEQGDKEENVSHQQQQIEILKQAQLELEEEKKLLTTKHEEQAELIDRQLHKIEEFTKYNAKLQQELMEARQSASLSLRLQTLREADLKDLQSRYQESQLILESQNQLLLKLSERLSVASKYFNQLTNSQIWLLENVNSKNKMEQSEEGNEKSIHPQILAE